MRPPKERFGIPAGRVVGMRSAGLTVRRVVLTLARGVKALEIPPAMVPSEPGRIFEARPVTVPTALPRKPKMPGSPWPL
jgi:hypothetical protein